MVKIFTQMNWHSCGKLKIQIQDQMVYIFYILLAYYRPLLNIFLIHIRNQTIDMERGKIWKWNMNDIKINIKIVPTKI